MSRWVLKVWTAVEKETNRPCCGFRLAMATILSGAIVEPSKDDSTSWVAQDGGSLLSVVTAMTPESGDSEVSCMTTREVVVVELSGNESSSTMVEIVELGAVVPSDGIVVVGADDGIVVVGAGDGIVVVGAGDGVVVVGAGLVGLVGLVGVVGGELGGEVGGVAVDAPNAAIAPRTARRATVSVSARVLARRLFMTSH